MSDHPSDEALLGWLETGRPARVERHLDECGPCMDRLDALSDLDPALRSGLATATAPPEDLVPRTADRVQVRVGAQDALSMVVELFALPWWTLDAVVDEERLTGGVVPASTAEDDDGDDDRGAT